MYINIDECYRCMELNNNIVQSLSEKYTLSSHEEAVTKIVHIISAINKNGVPQ